MATPGKCTCVHIKEKFGLLFQKKRADENQAANISCGFFFLHAEKCNLLTDRFFFGKKFCCFFFLTKILLFCKSMQAFCLCSNFHCNQFFTGISFFFFPLFSFGSSLKIPQTPVLSNIFSSSEILLPRKFFILLFFFRLHYLSSYRFTLHISPHQSSVWKNTTTNTTSTYSDWLERCLKTPKVGNHHFEEQFKNGTYWKSPFGSVLSGVENSKKGSTQNVMWSFVAARIGVMENTQLMQKLFSSNRT